MIPYLLNLGSRPPVSNRLLESGSRRLLEDGASLRLLEDGAGAVYLYFGDIASAGSGSFSGAISGDASAESDLHRTATISGDAAAPAVSGASSAATPAATSVRRRWTARPPTGWPIDRGHPLASGLLASWRLGEGAGPPTDSVAGLTATLQGTPWSSAPAGISCVPAGAGCYAVLPGQFQIPYPITVLCGFIYLGGTPSINAGIFGIFSNTAGAGVVNNARITWDSSGASIIGASAGFAPAAGIGYMPAVGVEVVYGLTVGAGNTAATLYCAGVPVNAYTPGGAIPSWGSTSNAAVGQIPGLSARSGQGVVTWAAILSRDVPAAEHADIAANPWRLSLPRRIRAATSVSAAIPAPTGDSTALRGPMAPDGSTSGSAAISTLSVATSVFAPDGAVASDAWLLAAAGADRGSAGSAPWWVASIAYADAGMSAAAALAGPLGPDVTAAAEQNLSAVTASVAYRADEGLADDDAWVRVTLVGATPIGSTDPSAARVLLAWPDPGRYCTDPLSARVIRP